MPKTMFMLTQTIPLKTSSYKVQTACRVCGSDKLTPYLDLGMLPLSNNLAESTLDPIHNERYPLQVLFCEKCGLSQLSIVIPPETLFRHYVYRSSISKSFTLHCLEMARELQLKHNLTPNSFHIDIAGNDGALLQQFQHLIGHKILNIDPAVNLAGICEAAHIPTLTEFWSMQTARKVVNTFGQADLITATNVFAHVDDVDDFMEGIKFTLKQGGVLVMEFPYLINFIESSEFDTVYHEHLSYFGIYPLTILCERHGLQVLNVTKQQIHGGSVRVTIGYGMPDNTVSDLCRIERILYRHATPYHNFAEDIFININNFKDGLHKLNGSVAGFAASAKGTTLLNCAGITPGSIRYIVDATPEKIGKYQPGTRIPIVSMDDLMRNPPDYLILLAWNWANELMAKARTAGYKGRFVIPIPNFTIID